MNTDEQQPGIEPRYFNTKILGRVRIASEVEQQLLKELANACPQALFSALNKKLNEHGLRLLVEKLDQPT